MRTEVACNVGIHESLCHNVCVTPWGNHLRPVCKAIEGGKIFRDFLDETCRSNQPVEMCVLGFVVQSAHDGYSDPQAGISGVHLPQINRGTV